MAVPPITHDVDRTERPFSPVPRTIVLEALRALGGGASLPELYRYLETRRSTANAHWREKVRQVAQQRAAHVGPGRYALPEAA